MAESDVQPILQRALLALLDSKPEKPIEFLINHFQKEGEKTNLVTQAAHLLESIKSHHPATEERLLQAYNIISQYRGRFKFQKEVQGLTGDIYTDLLGQLLHGFPDSYVDKLLQKLRCHSDEYIPFLVFRAGVLTTLLLKECIQEAQELFKQLDTEGKRHITRSLGDCALTQLCTALTATANDPFSTLEMAVSLEVSQLCRTFDEEVKNVTTWDSLMTENEFVSEAVDVFLHQVPSTR
ncbi:tubulin polyglutamylase complex subunit 1-like isoform X2 [Limulus polyphemus]|uniref:Tubulin polyglutamylase complex subunit 1-like isoform X2 n=1 Tax=Limulus polyphemus TaxID=6850 RepID=A0ABM1SGL1_LIMPO|nr:tubulin polyglutamylase complex subunit 1-like isoform X2 [Limulus polyphemus]XP_022242763.1 tubulin polyglutamylase complex subunit 1-like isoform X2 [Limulus polyphemus]XP_022242764.1 tubulin polyglutamylase complex subunit 1-like isoform X2 [Limulus polyphemus]XP_022242765.1 tubulin polyglutamylase complex subunit 1-like isoform X2 [Limulus polyphemus]XP_022242766.1 tubulin polyglutamylase complex subunit 1-like isoform X2 [Limulus polyphemus]